MKKLAAILCLSALTTGAFAQGLVTMGNGPTTQISASTGASGASVALASGNAGTYYFGLLTQAAAGGPYAFANVYGTNSAGAGRIAGYTTSVAGWAAGQTLNYEVAGWSASLGTTWSAGWLTGNFGGKSGYFTVSSPAAGTAGGGSPVPAPAWNLFGGSGLTGFNLAPAGVPEPTSMALAGLGAAALLIFRRRK
jgi:hypothetical protein